MISLPDNGDPDGACPDLVSFCNSNSAVQPLLPSVTGPLDNNLDCVYVAGYSDAVAATDPSDQGCRDEVKPREDSTEIKVEFICPAGYAQQKNTYFKMSY